MHIKAGLRAVIIREGLVRPIVPLVRFINMGSTKMLRREFKFITRLSPLPPGLRIERTDLGGIPAEILIPPNDSRTCALMYIHGGGYAFGSPRTHRVMVGRLAIYARMRVYLPKYRLAPEHPYPAALDDAGLAWNALGKHEKRLVLAGESAGGGLCAALCQRIIEKGWQKPERLYLQSPWLDLSLKQKSYKTLNFKDPIMKRRWLASEFVPLYSGGADPHERGISPIYGKAEGFPPTLIHVGTHELFYDEALFFSEKLKKAGIDVQVQIGHGLWHAWQLFAPFIPEAKTALRDAGKFLRFRQ